MKLETKYKKWIALLFLLCLSLICFSCYLHIRLGTKSSYVEFWVGNKEKIEVIEPKQEVVKELTPIVYMESPKIIEPSYVLPDEYREYVIKLCYENNVPLWLFCRLIFSESEWKKTAIHRNYKVINGVKTLMSTDKGIAQLNDKFYDTFRWKYNDGIIVDPWDPYMSLKIACRYLRDLQNNTLSWYDTLCAYKTGLRTVFEGTVPERYHRIVSKLMEV